MVHSETLAELVVTAALLQTGFKRYEQLLAKLFLELAGIELKTLVCSNSSKPLLEEASKLQDVRNGVIHRGNEVSQPQAQFAIELVTQVFDKVLAKVLENLGLAVNKGGVLAAGEG